MEGEFPLMILSMMISASVFFSSLLAYGTAMHLIVRAMVRVIRSGTNAQGFWKSTAVVAIVTLITAVAHLIQMALWAVAFLLCGEFATFDAAFYFSAQNFTALGYGDVLPSERWRLLGPLEAINGTLFFGLSAAVLFAVMSNLIFERLRIETGYQNGAGVSQPPFSVTGVLSSK